jgi:hypothetical protein
MDPSEPKTQSSSTACLSVMGFHRNSVLGNEQSMIERAIA